MHVNWTMQVRGGDAGRQWENSHILETDKDSLPGLNGLRVNMYQQMWPLIFTVEFIWVSSQSLLPKRQCVFQANTQNNSVRYTAAGNVSGSVQVCENTRCCVGYFRVTNDQPEVDVLACDITEKTCPHAACIPRSRLVGKVIKCVCNTDLCNSNITWIHEQPTYSYSPGKIMIPAGFILAGALFILGFSIAKFITCFRTAKQRSPSTGQSLFCIQKQEEVNLLSSGNDCYLPALCPCRTIKSSEIDFSDIELKQILDRGQFGTVWQGEYQGSTVAVKVFSSDWNHRFSAEKEVYELPLMKHAGIVHFLGTGRKPDRSCLIVLQLAEYGSLHSYLCKHTTSWMLSLKLCQSLSEGLSYLHSDLRIDEVHKPSVAHRDLSSSNILVRADGTCVLCDFGCSTILRSCSGPITSMEGQAQIGTLRYTSPEFLEGFVNLTSGFCLIHADIYSLGLLLWEIWMRCSDLFEGGIVPPHLLPYESELGPNVTLEELVQFVFHMQKRPTIPKHWEWLPQGSALEELLTDCWDCDPDARLTVPCVLDRLVSLQACCFP